LAVTMGGGGMGEIQKRFANAAALCCFLHWASELCVERLDLVLQSVFHVGEVKLLACATFEDVEYVLTSRLEV